MSNSAELATYLISTKSLLTLVTLTIATQLYLFYKQKIDSYRS